MHDNMHDNLGAFLTKRAFLTPDLGAYIDSHSDLRLTFAELNARSNQVANAFLAAGLGKGERVGLLMMNSPEFMEACFALAKLGAVAVPLNWRLVPDELQFILKDSGAKRLIFGSEFAEAAAELRRRGDGTDVRHWLQVADGGEVAGFAESYAEFRDGAAADEPRIDCGGDDLLYIVYTSGTTGLPKGAVQTHNSAIWSLLTMAATVDYRKGDCFLNTLPMFHVGALTPCLVNVYRGISSVVMRSFEPKLAWQLLEREKVSIALMVPAMLNFMLQVPGLERFDCSGLRWILTGAAPVPVTLTEQYAKLGIDVLQVYGLTECCGPVCLIDAENALRKPDSTGKSFFHTSVRVVDEHGQDCAPDQPGEVLVAGPHIMREYWNQPKATAEAVVDGWLHTGDVAVMDEEGFVSIRDRMKDMIISGGENVYPAEVEGVLMTHPDILEAAVIGMRSETWGESPLAIVVRKGEALAEAEVLEHCQGRLARYKQPKAVAFVKEIPRNPSGKILKRVLREQFPGPSA